jgi:signal peptidase
MKLKVRQRSVLIDILVIVALLATVIIAYVGAQLLLATDTPFVVIASGSMSPALEVGDIIIVQKVASTSIAVGDIIVFDSPEEIRTIHRVSQIQTLPNGTMQFKTKGDANPSEETYWTSEEDVHGRVLYKIPYLGWLALIPTIPITIAVIIIIITLVWPENHRRRRKHKH